VVEFADGALSRPEALPSFEDHRDGLRDRRPAARPDGSAWFGHFNSADSVTHVDIRGPTYKGSLTGGAKSLFCLPPSRLAQALPRLVLAEAAIDTLSVAALEDLPSDTIYAATGGGMGPGTIAELEALLAQMAMLPGAVFCSATDANGPGDRFAERHRGLRHGNCGGSEFSG
jgi:hypothetical protein